MSVASMARASLPGSEGINMSAKLRSLYTAPKLDISIHLHGQRKTYTTLDQLEGAVSITAMADTSFDEVEIEFVGTSRTYVERLTTAAAVSGRSEAFHQFLKLQQPGLQQHYPDDLVFRAGQVYTFPFIFVIPQQLLPRICRHTVVSEALRDVHLQLPPTFGDKDPGRTSELMDDMVPDMASIRYGIFARVSKDKEQGERAVQTTVASKAKRVRVIPAMHEQPPLDVGGEDNEYVVRREKAIRKGVLKGKLGTLVMEAVQPPSARLHARSDGGSHSASMATIMLRFDPIDERMGPPRLGSMSSKLKVCTFFASTARTKCPSKSSSAIDLSQGLHTEQLNLSSRCMANVEWTKHDGTKTQTFERRDSAQSAFSVTAGQTPDPSSAYQNRGFYTARLIVPVSLPSNRSFVPTFHSCLVSRIYQLKFELGVQTTGIGGSMELKLPFQITSDAPNGESTPHRGSVDSAMETPVNGEDVADFFEPRTIPTPPYEFIGRSRIGSQAPVEEAPPGYSFTASAGTARLPVY